MRSRNRLPSKFSHQFVTGENVGDPYMKTRQIALNHITTLLVVLSMSLMAASAATPPRQAPVMSSHPTHATTAADEEAIRALMQQLVQGWNTGSGDGFAAPFAEDADFVAFDGSRFKGCQEIAQVHQELFDTFLQGTRIRGEVTSVRFLRPDVAVMHAIGGTVLPGHTDASPGRDSMQIGIVTKHEGAWRIDVFQNARMPTIQRQVFLDHLDALPAEAQRQVMDLVASLLDRDHTRGGKAGPRSERANEA
jgi:uncharacterized protein (TIGR02246 family)